MKRIGIYSGTFDPVHAGHIGFALQAMEAAQLDTVYFLPERRPRDKTGTEHFGHRVAMLRRATKPHRRLHVLELEDVSFTVDRTMARLQKRFPKAQLVFLFGSDVVQNMNAWPGVERLITASELVVGIRSQDSLGNVENALAALPVQPTFTIIESYGAEVSSRKIREALRQRQYVPGLLSSVQRYSNRNWLYISLV